MDLSMYDQVAIEKAKKRGRAYQCLACHFKKGQRWIDEIGKLEDHILRLHMPPERVPFSCQLCLFKCLRRDQLLRHVSHYARHVTMAAGRNIVNHEPWLRSSENPYVITELDYFKLSPEESLKFFLERSAGSGRSSSIDTSLAKLVDGTLGSDISQDTLQAGFIIASPDLGAQQPRVASARTNRQAQVTMTFSPTSTQPMAATSHVLGQPLPNLVHPRQAVPITEPRSTVVPVMPQPAVLTRGTGFTTFSPRVLLQDSVQPMVAAQRTMQGQPLTGQFPSQQALTISVPTATMASTMSLLDELTSGTSFTTDSSMASIQSKSAAQCMPCQRLTSLFQPLQTQPMSVPTSTTDPMTPLLDESTRGASVGSTPNFQVPDQDHGSYSPSSPLGSDENPLLVGSCTKISEPAVSNSAFATQLPVAEGNVANLLEQPLPVTTSEGQQAEGPDGTGHRKDLTEQTDIVSEAEENLMPQLLPREDMSITSGDNIDGGRKQRARREREIEEDQDAKRRRLEDREDGESIRVSLVAINGLVTAVQGLTEQMKRREKKEEQLEKALIDTTCALSGVADSLSRLRNKIEENAKEERKREERWLERERQREEERRKDREAEQRRENRRREAEKKEREEIRRLLTQHAGKEERKRDRPGAVRCDEEKENTKTIKSVLGKSYTETNVKDLSKRN